MNSIRPATPSDRAAVDALNACGRYLSVSVLRHADGRDCTNGGLTSREFALFIPHPEGPYSAADLTDEIHAGRLLEVVPPAFAGCPLRVKPAGLKRHSMSGGNFVFTSDSRFAEVYGGPVSVHDRVEG